MLDCLAQIFTCFCLFFIRPIYHELILSLIYLSSPFNYIYIYLSISLCFTQFSLQFNTQLLYIRILGCPCCCLRWNLSIYRLLSKANRKRGLLRRVMLVRKANTKRRLSEIPATRYVDCYLIGSVTFRSLGLSVGWLVSRLVCFS